MTHILLSHHYPEDYDHCVPFKFKGETYNLCTRCLGYFSSFFIFIWLYLFIDNYVLHIDKVIIYLFPSFAFIDWGLTKTKVYNGNNSIRYVTGFLLGIAGSRIIFLFFKNPFNSDVYISISIYFVIAAIMIYSTKRIMKLN